MGKKSGQSSAKSKATKAPKRRGWTSDEQFSYLDSILPTYRGAQTNNTTQEMWGPIEEHWFSHWPLSAPTDAEVEKGLTDHERRKKVMDVSASYLCEVPDTHIIFDSASRLGSGITPVILPPTRRPALKMSSTFAVESRRSCPRYRCTRSFITIKLSRMLSKRDGKKSWSTRKLIQLSLPNFQQAIFQR